MTLGKKIAGMITAIILLTVGAIVLYTTTLLGYSDSASKQTYKKLDTTPKENIIAATEPFSVLLMGVDTDAATRGGGWDGRSDSMIIVTVNPKLNKTVMMSLDRDIMVEIANQDGSATGTVEKLNHSYAYGQAPMTIATIEKMMDIDINYYVQINMDGLKDLVNAVGGIQVNNTLDFPVKIYEQEPAYTATVDPGEQHINGDQAIVYARMRYDDPEGDIGRQRRQREVIGAIVSKVLHLNGVANYKSIFDAVSSNLQTDIEFSTANIPSLLSYRDAARNIESYQVEGEGQMVNEIYYQIPTSEHLLEMQNILKTSLGLPVSMELKTNVGVYESVFGLFNPITVINAYTGEVVYGLDVAVSTPAESYETYEESYTEETVTYEE